MMFIPPGKHPKRNIHPPVGENEVALRDGHLIIGCEVARQVFGQSLNALITYYPQRRTLLLSKVSDEVFKSMHKSEQALLKLRNARGDIAVSIQGILVDHQIDDTDRTLPWESPEGSHILMVVL